MLPTSETFIRNQVDSCHGTDVILFGSSVSKSNLSRDSDVVLYGSSLIDRICRRLFKSLGISSRVKKFAQTNGIDLIHAHFLADAALIAPMARRLGIPLVITLHGYDITERRVRARGGAWLSRREAFAVGYASKIICVSEFIQRRAVATGIGASKTCVRYIGTPITDLVVKQKSTWDIVFVGRLAEKKGVSDLLAALQRLPTSLQPCRVAVVGYGDLRSDLEMVSSSSLAQIEFLGSMKPDEIRGIFAECSIFVGPSKAAANGDSEGFGMVFLEAALAQLPVIAYRHGGVPESVLEDVTGFLSDEGDIQGLSDNISRLLKRPDLRKSFGKEGRRRVEAEFDINRLSKELESLYIVVGGGHE
ncbi:glycosyltransferase [Cryobacterium sp. PH31-L1]|uniref:glycosyltransferase n=1 Tax=Cryobacterium sp. PH31-L1 TaxID=3046199 RepID=UPI0024B964DD|nr:glycosyltransferase [Cryobacterium sp. PH31-L1]MDJ0376970.1 glycosyltransferase [Cryobacterium sp. PH31-L1]